jgi:uncharacterized protein YndB with AHSA1/START domain
MTWHEPLQQSCLAYGRAGTARRLRRRAEVTDGTAATRYLVRAVDGGVMRGEFVELIPHQRIVFTFGWEPGGGAPPAPPGSSRVETTLTDDGGDTIMTLRHYELPGSVLSLHRSGWAWFLSILPNAGRNQLVPGRGPAHDPYY